MEEWTVMIKDENLVAVLHDRSQAIVPVNDVEICLAASFSFPYSSVFRPARHNLVFSQDGLDDDLSPPFHSFGDWREKSVSSSTSAAEPSSVHKDFIVMLNGLGLAAQVSQFLVSHSATVFPIPSGLSIPLVEEVKETETKGRRAGNFYQLHFSYLSWPPASDSFLSSCLP